jgi:hypothetical protein
MCGLRRPLIKGFLFCFERSPAGHTKASLENNHRKYRQNSAFPKLKLVNYCTKANEFKN